MGLPNRHAEGSIFNDENWKNLRAPVVPPAWVTEQVRRTKLPVDWSSGANREDDETLPKGERNWLMFFRTELENDEVVTRLLTGSAQPVKEWLR